LDRDAVRVGYLPDPRDPGGVYIDGRRIGTVEKIVMDEPDPDLPGPYIRRALREEFMVRLREQGPRGGETPGC
jgi:hypothetical protein